MKHNSKRLRQVRESMGMTQEKLSILASVSERTVQRAEAGQSMSLETLNDFAAALEMPLSELVMDPDEINSEEPLGLRRVHSARLLLEDLAKAGVAVFECEVDANSAELGPLLNLVDLVEARLPVPWEEDQRPGAGSLKERLSTGAEVSRLLSELQDHGIGLFTSSSWIMAQYPRYDIDVGHRYTQDRQPFERVMALHLVIARGAEERLYRRTPTAWGGLTIKPAALPAQGGFADDLDEDISF